jgi:AraC-like DNA-binding protein
VQFNAAVTGFVCASSVIERARPVQETLVARDARAHLEGLLAQHQPGVAAKVRETIAWLLPTGLCSAETVARRLGLQRRTLHRYLAREGETYASLLDEVRRDLARELIGQQRRPLKQVAEELGFEGPSALSRWFRHQFGYSTTEWISRLGDRAA